MVMHNTHQPTEESRQRVSDLVMCGTPIYLISEVIDIDEATLQKHYAKEIKTAKSIAIERIGKTVYQQALNGNEKSQVKFRQGWLGMDKVRCAHYIQSCLNCQ